jgi:hypothetical protein
MNRLRTRLKKTFAVLGLAFLAAALSGSLLAATAAAAGPEDLRDYKPNMGIPIPTIKFSGISVKSITKQGDNGQPVSVKALDVPWIANYVGGIYEYASEIAVFLGAVMIVIGGFQYSTAGGDSAKVGAAKERISNAIVGMLLVLLAYTILQTVNTQLTQPADLLVESVKGEPFQPNLTERPGVQERGGPASDQQPGSPSAGAEGAVIDGFKKAAQELGVDPCVMIGIGDHESGNKLNIWNGKPGGLPRDKAVAWGPGQVIHPNFVSCNSKSPKPLSIALKKKFPDKWPDDGLPCADEKQKKTDLMITDADVSTYAATYTFKGAGGSKGNELYALAAYAAGGGSIQRWRSTNNCPGAKVSMSEAASMGFDAAMKKACLPVNIVAVPGAGASCADGGHSECANAKIDKTATFVGTCQGGSDDGKKCVGMDTNGFIKYIINRYKAIKEKYNC